MRDSDEPNLIVRVAPDDAWLFERGHHAPMIIRWSTWSTIATTARHPRHCEPERERFQPVDDMPIANLGPLTVAGASTWEAITELATLIPLDRWAIVGGQMAAIHAALAGVEPPRVTDDGDVVVDVRVFGRGAMRMWRHP